MGGAIALGFCVAIDIASKHENFTWRREGGFCLSPSPCDNSPYAGRPLRYGVMFRRVNRKGMGFAVFEMMEC